MHTKFVQVYGSRLYEEKRQREALKPKIGIYDRREHSNSKISVTEGQKSSRIEKEASNEASNLLDPDYLKTMDKKLKKLIRKNLNRDLKSEARSRQDCLTSQKENPIAWDIPVASNKCDDAKNDGREELSDNSLENMSTSFQSHPYLPLKDVPMHELVKKLQREFELEGECKNLPADMNKLWLK